MAEPIPQQDSKIKESGITTNKMDIKPGFISSFIGLSAMMFYERISVKKLLSLAFKIVLLPAFIFLIFSPDLSGFGRAAINQKLFNQKFDLEEAESEIDGFEAFMQPENAPPSPLESHLQKISEKDSEFNEIASDDQKGKGMAFAKIVFEIYFIYGIPIVCVIFAGGLSRDEIRNDTLPFFLCRPISRVRYISIRLLCQVIWTEVIMAILTGLLFGVGILKGVPWLIQSIPYFFLAQILAIPAFCALGILMGLINKNFLIFAIIYGAIVEIGIASLSTNIKVIALSTHMKTILGQSDLAMAIFTDSWADTPFVTNAIIPMVVAFGVFLVAAAITFHYKELLPSREVES